MLRYGTETPEWFSGDLFENLLNYYIVWTVEVAKSTHALQVIRQKDIKINLIFFLDRAGVSEVATVARQL